MRSHRIAGGGGLLLHVVEAGNPAGRPILFIHGISQCWLSWIRQLNSGLADEYHLVAVDMRGHGLSEAPAEVYGDSRLWADDLHAVIRTLRLDHPLLCGWSYGPLMILDYVRHFGEDEICGANFVGGITKLGSEQAGAVLTPALVNLIPGLLSADATESVRSLAALLRLCFVRELSTEDGYRMLGYSASVPPHVRQGLLSRCFDNDDLLPKLRKPILITHGEEDAVVTPLVLEQQMAHISCAEMQRMPEVGHGCFWDDATAYNRSLAQFLERL